MPMYNMEIACLGSAILSADTPEAAAERARRLPMAQIHFSEERAVACHGLMDHATSGRISRKIRKLRQGWSEIAPESDAARRMAPAMELVELYANGTSSADFADLFKALSGQDWEDYVDAAVRDMGAVLDGEREGAAV